MLCLEISLIAFLLQNSYASGLETLTRNFAVSGIIIGVDILFKVPYSFAFSMTLKLDMIKLLDMASPDCKVTASAKVLEIIVWA